MHGALRILTAVALASGALAAPAAAQQPRAVGNTTGTLQVSGGGQVVLEGDAIVIGVVRGPALIVVQDRAGDVRLSVGGRLVRPLRARPAPPFLTTRRHRLPGGRQRFLLSGTDMRVRVTSADQTLSASGRMRVRLRGEGTYSVDSGPPQAWLSGATVWVGLTRPARQRVRTR